MTETTLNLGTPFTEIADEAKAWVYTCSQDFTAAQIAEVEKYAEVFLSQWDSHGKLVKGTIQVIRNRFIAIFADTEDTMCGRAQDASVNFMKELEQILGVKLMDRMLVAIKKNETIETLSFINLRSKIASGEIAKATTFYNGLIASKAEFLSDWERPIEGSWL
ncbi:MAG: hypothetical protein ABF242_08900 [Flavobacteriales bacterium]